MLYIYIYIYILYVYIYYIYIYVFIYIFINVIHMDGFASFNTLKFCLESFVKLNEELVSWHK